MEAIGCVPCGFWCCAVVGRSVVGACQGGGLTVSDQCRNAGVKLRHLAKWGMTSTQGGGLMPSEVDPILARYLWRKLWP